MVDALIFIQEILFWLVYIVNAGDGVVGLGDFNSSATFLSNMNFPGLATVFPWGTHFQDFNVDVTSGVQALIDSSSPYIEFRLETEQATAYLSAGETSTPDSFGSGGPRLTLNFLDGRTVVPEPATMVLLGSGLIGGAFIRRKRS